MISKHVRQLAGGVECNEYCDARALVSDPLVSVMMLTYNHAPYIQEAIEGVISQQTAFPFELLIAEDCSTDSTMEVVLDNAAKYPSVIRVISSDTNVGGRLNSRRAHGLCRGKYLAFCEGDDYWHDPMKLAKQVDLLENDGGIVLVHSDLDFLFQVDQIRIPRFQHHKGFRFNEQLTPRERFEAILASEEICYTPTVVYRLALMNEIMLEDPHVFHSSYFPMGDTPRWLELALRGRFAYIDESTATLRRIAESATRGKDHDRLIQFRAKSIELRWYYKRKYGSDDHRFHRMLNRLSRDAFYRSCLAGDQASARHLKELVPQMDSINRALYLLALSKPLNILFNSLVWIPIAVRQRFQKAKYRERQIRTR